jgi:hypothetical protein
MARPSRRWRLRSPYASGGEGQPRAQDHGDLQEDRARQPATGRADGTQQRQARRLLGGDDQEEQPHHERDHRCEQGEDHAEGLADADHPRVLRGGVAGGQGVEVSRSLR